LTGRPTVTGELVSKPFLFARKRSGAGEQNGWTGSHTLAHLGRCPSPCMLLRAIAARHPLRCAAPRFPPPARSPTPPVAAARAKPFQGAVPTPKPVSSSLISTRLRLPHRSSRAPAAHATNPTSSPGPFATMASSVSTSVVFFDCDDCLYKNDWKVANLLTAKIEEFCKTRVGMEEGHAYELYKKYGTCLRGRGLHSLTFQLNLSCLCAPHNPT